VTADGSAELGGVACDAEPRPGDACRAGSEPCGQRRCGVARSLECVTGEWALQPLSWQGASSPWDFECDAEAIDTAGGICEVQAQCCGQPVAQATGCALEGGCALCPEDEPVDGAPCELPAACDGTNAPRVLDCYYPCCCYGTATWAQCSGERWHVHTSCSPK
jgi:hypothetical protein